MDSAEKWALTVSVCAVISCIVEMLSSDTRLEKNVRMTLGLFMLCAVVIPLGGVVTELSTDLEISDISYETDITDDMNSQRISYLERVIKKLVTERLGEKGIVPLNVEVAMDIGSDNSISIITAEITIDKKDAASTSEITALLREELGIESKTVISQQ